MKLKKLKEKFVNILPNFKCIGGILIKCFFFIIGLYIIILYDTSLKCFLLGFLLVTIAIVYHYVIGIDNCENI